MKKATSQTEALSDEGSHGTAALVGSLALFHFGTDNPILSSFKVRPAICPRPALIGHGMLQSLMEELRPRRILHGK